MFSYANNSCHRNHRRYTLCGYHFSEEHEGNWKTCMKCRAEFGPEMVAWYGTNEYNFEKMPDPPSYQPTKCSLCGTVIKLGTDGYTRSVDEYWCERCTAKEMKKRVR
jgi:NAD-dependent SIR2 family protein deacetylase